MDHQPTLPSSAAASRGAAAPPTLDADDAQLQLPDERHDVWTLAKQAAFLRALSATHNVAASARSVGMSRQSAYKLRARLRGQPFDYAWAAAFQSSFDALAEAAMDRAVNGVEVHHYHGGELVGTSRRYDERLTLALLTMRGSFRPAPKPEWHAASAFGPEEFGALVGRVERGPENWKGDSNAELDGIYATDAGEEDAAA